MRRLYLLRHAKSSWDDTVLPDRDRPLAPRGRKAARRIAEHLRSEEATPKLVLCSSALRTRQTLAALLPVLAGDVEIRLEEGLYGAGAAQVLARVREVEPAVSSVLVIGHNPTLHELALYLTDGADALDRFPTGALAGLVVATAWAELGEGGAELDSFVVPRELDR